MRLWDALRERRLLKVVLAAAVVSVVVVTSVLAGVWLQHNHELYGPISNRITTTNRSSNPGNCCPHEWASIPRNGYLLGPGRSH